MEMWIGTSPLGAPDYRESQRLEAVEQKGCPLKGASTGKKKSPGHSGHQSWTSLPLLDTWYLHRPQRSSSLKPGTWVSQFPCSSLMLWLLVEMAWTSAVWSISLREFIAHPVGLQDQTFLTNSPLEISGYYIVLTVFVIIWCLNAPEHRVSRRLANYQSAAIFIPQLAEGRPWSGSGICLSFLRLTWPTPTLTFLPRKGFEWFWR